jgi:hypothetical protein
MGDSIENLQRQVEELEQRVAALSGRLLADARGQIPGKGHFC